MAVMIDEVEGLYHIVKLSAFRQTPGVTFDMFPMDLVSRIDSIDRVIHKEEAQSPGAIDDIKEPWYMHDYQDDHLIVLQGHREVDIYTPEHGKVEHFTVTPDKIYKGDQLIYDGGAILIWPRGVFHRIHSGKEGSASLNIATHYDGFDIRKNFNIYQVDYETGEYWVIRYGFEDQK